MQFMPARRGRAVMINITSLIDVMFLLLIFFMVTSTFKNQPAIDLALPRSTTAEETLLTTAIIYLTREGQLFLDNAVIDREELAVRLRRQQAATGEDQIVLRADEQAEHGAVVSLIDLIKESGYRRVSLAARPAGGP